MSYLDRSYPRAKDKKNDPYVHACPDIPAGMDLTELVDPKSNDVANETLRIAYVLGIMGHLLETYRIDTDRIYLTAEGASTPFAARLVSLFPDRFAGLILVNPAAGVDISIVADNLSNVPVLVLHDKEHGPAAKRLDNRLTLCQRESMKSGSLSRSYVKTIKAWTDKVRRKFYAKRVVFTQSSNRFKKAYWVQIEESPALTDVKQPPRIEASYDRSSNRISIKTRHVSRAHIFLNDLMVDLDKEVVFDINGSVFKTKLLRSKRLLWGLDSGLVIMRGDPRILFVSSISIDIPQEHKLLGL